jgi:hypothetical protein
MAVRSICAAWVLVASVMLRLDPPLAILYLDAQDSVESAVDVVAREACPHLRVDRVPLPIPFEIRWLRKDGESARYVPDPARRVTGLLTSCP